MITDMDIWTNIRRDVLTGGMSRREACKKYNLNFRTIQKILSHAEPPGYCQAATRDKPTIGPFVPIIHEILPTMSGGCSSLLLSFSASLDRLPQFVF